MDEELFQQMQEAAKRFNSGESDFEEIMTPNGPARIVRDASDPRGFTIEFVGDGARESVPVQQYPAAPTRLPGYPAPLPFLPECAATVDTGDQSVTWANPPEPLASLEHLYQESIDDGWTVLERQERSFVLEKEGVERALLLTLDSEPPILVLVERPSEQTTG